MLAKVIPITRAKRRRPTSTCTPLTFQAARARLTALRPCFGTPQHARAFVECVDAWVRERNVVRIGKGVRNG